jgi:hypothetical protein
VGIAFLIATLGVDVAHYANIPSLHIGSGAYGGFVGAGLVLVGAFGPLRWPALDRGRMRVRAVPVLACLACVAAVVVPAWQGVLPAAWTPKADAVHSWFAVATLLLVLHLLRLWVAQIGQASAAARGLVLTPLLILPMPILELIQDRAVGIVWGGVILIGLCLLLAVLGWFEQRGGLENFRFPELFRVDRLPSPES